VLLQTPLHAAGEIDNVIAAVKSAEMPEDDIGLRKDIPASNPLCQRSCRLNRIGTFGGAESRKWLDTDKRIKNG
jgi:hypothetical protein